jgi:hypothetical protein
VHKTITWSGALALALSMTMAAGCSKEPGRIGDATPVYNKQTGALEELQSDRDGDGKVDTRAFMDGVRLKHVEIDRNADGKTDRWEFYVAAPGAPAGGAQTVLSHVEEAGAFDGRVTLREFYQSGVKVRVEEDTDLDGRIDKWEAYERGVLARVDLDLIGKGYPSQRLIYRGDGNLDRIETDPDGDGAFVPLPAGGRGGQ